MSKPAPKPEWESHPTIAAYRAFELRLGQVREKHLGQDSQEEDDLLDEGDTAWWAMSNEEHDYIREVEGPHYQYAIKYLKP